jgi:hypothetical protein
MTIHVIHILGKRMITQGMYGCSHGLLLEGVMYGANILTFDNLAKDRIE